MDDERAALLPPDSSVQRSKQGLSFPPRTLDGHQPRLDDVSAEGSFSPMAERSPGGVSNFEAFLHIVKCNIGTGLLGLPFAFKYAGLVVGAVSMVFVALVATHCMYLLVKASHRLCKLHRRVSLDYAGVAELCVTQLPAKYHQYGWLGRGLVNLFLVVTQVGFCAVYALFVSKNLTQVFHASGWEFTFREVILMLVPLFMIGVFIRDLKTLAIFSGIANALQFICIVIIFQYILRQLKWHEAELVPNRPTDLSLFFGLAMFSLEGIGVILPLENDVAKPKTFHVVIWVSMFVVSVNYIAMGFFGYLAFPGPDDQIKGSITLNLPADRKASAIPYIYVKLFYGTSIFLSYFLQFYVAIDILAPHLMKILPARLRVCSERLFRLFIVCLTAALAAGVPALGLFISLVGAFGSSALAMIFPATLDNIVFWKELPIAYKVKNMVISTIGVIGMIVGTYATIVELNKQL